MDRPFAAFDLEIRNPPANMADWKENRPLGISCAGLMMHDEYRVWEGSAMPGGQLSQEQCQSIVQALFNLLDQNARVVTWNGASFDFDILAEESDLYDDCVTLANLHIDLMFIVVVRRQHYLSLAAAAAGMNVTHKLKAVELLNGETIDNMDGAKAPELWEQGEYEAVLTYLEGDCLTTLELAEAIQEQRELRWMSRKGKRQHMQIWSLGSVRHFRHIPQAIPAWKTDPLDREQVLAWTTDETRTSRYARDKTKTLK